MKNIFISYDQEDREFANQLAHSLEKQGITAVMSGHEVGSNWLEGLKDQVKLADGFILVMPEMLAPSSNSTFFEAGVARALGKEVVVVVPDLQKVDRSNIPFDLAKAVVVDAAKQPLESVTATVLGAVDH